VNGLRIIAEDRDADDIAAILRERQRAVAGIDTAAPRSTEALLTFDIDGVRHGLPIATVLAVAPLPPVARLPHGPAALTGLVAWRGAVANLFTPAAALGRGPGSPTAMILLRHDHPRIALAVDALPGVVAADVEDAPPALARLVDSEDGRLTRVDPVLLIESLLPSRLQEG
jgi:purine-binding chemotaxis protein CheW